MPLRPMHHVTVTVSSLDRSLEFYRDLLGMRVTLEATIADEAHERYLRLPTGTVGRAAVLQLGPPVGAVEIVEWEVPGTTGTAPDVARPPQIGSFVLAFEVSDEPLDDMVARLRDAGVTVWGEPEASEIDDYGTIRAVVVEDPDGMLVELLELPSREAIAAARGG